MSPVLDLQVRFREIGRIRMGEKRTSRAGKPYPAAIERFRFTSPSRGVLQGMAQVVGGDVAEWTDAPGGAQWQLYAETGQIAVVIPPSDEPYSQWYELWSGAGCQRRCNGVRATVAVKQGSGDDAPVVMREQACVCDEEARECKLTTRASFILPWAPGIGVWRLESHGYNAAVELTGTLAYLARQAAQGVYLECTLRLDKREKRVPGKPTNEYVVPVLDTEATPAQLLAGTMPPAAQLSEAPSGRPALPSGGAGLPPQAPAFTDPAQGDRGGPAWGAPPPPPSGESARREGTAPAAPVGLSDSERGGLFARASQLDVDSITVRNIARVLFGHGVSAMSPDELPKLEANVARYAENQSARDFIDRWVAEHPGEAAA